LTTIILLSAAKNNREEKKLSMDGNCNCRRRDANNLLGNDIFARRRTGHVGQAFYKWQHILANFHRGHPKRQLSQQLCRLKRQRERKQKQGSKKKVKDLLAQSA